jgi:hypothetical protein
LHEAIDWMFFFTAPIVLSVTMAFCLGVAVLLTMREGAAELVSQT